MSQKIHTLSASPRQRVASAVNSKQSFEKVRCQAELGNEADLRGIGRARTCQRVRCLPTESARPRVGSTPPDDLMPPRKSSPENTAANVDLCVLASLLDLDIRTAVLKGTGA